MRVVLARTWTTGCDILLLTFKYIFKMITPEAGEAISTQDIHRPLEALRTTVGRNGTMGVVRWLKSCLE